MRKTNRSWLDSSALSNPSPFPDRVGVLTGSIMENIITNAVLFGITHHGKQVRKYSGIPYFTHCCEVAQIVSRVCHEPGVIAAAYLHDVLE